MTGNVLLAAGIILLLLALALLLLLVNERRSRRKRLLVDRRRELGLPDGELVYEDADGQGGPLSSSTFRLIGKPDYVVQAPDGRPLPVELQLNGQHAAAPYSNHMAQLAAYCLILEDYF